MNMASCDNIVYQLALVVWWEYHLYGTFIALGELIITTSLVIITASTARARFCMDIGGCSHASESIELLLNTCILFLFPLSNVFVNETCMGNFWIAVAIFERKSWTYCNSGWSLLFVPWAMALGTRLLKSLSLRLVLTFVFIDNWGMR
jgi:hypothetical protein